MSVSDVEGTSDRALALLWRVAQEAVRNAIRHGEPATLSVVVTGDENLVFLDVADDGRGFDTDQPRPDRHFGLRGLGSLVGDAGGRLVVRSAPGDGTVLHLEVSKQ
ncbi:MAG: hypothetical protein R2731_01455 [Nocardioides sp.]